MSGHPKLEDGAFIHTSPIQQMVMDEEHKLLQFVAASESNYAVAFDDIDYTLKFIKKNRACLQNLNVSSHFVDEAVILSNSRKQWNRKTTDRAIITGMTEVADRSRLWRNTSLEKTESVIRLERTDCIIRI